jgi:hypothetical protein
MKNPFITKTILEKKSILIVLAPFLCAAKVPSVFSRDPEITKEYY